MLSRNDGLADARLQDTIHASALGTPLGYFIRVHSRARLIIRLIGYAPKSGDKTFCQLE